MRTLAFVVVVAVTACSGGTPSGSSADASGGACTKALYDPCIDEHSCGSSQVCQTFSDVTPGIEVCSQGCTMTTPCPNDSTGSPATCDTSVNLCRPAKANACTGSL
ncbi:MAG TPA: hypothetical protein VGG28_20215 [Kofleriaceae bacterium]|jgi:hypothetical protein